MHPFKPLPLPDQDGPVTGLRREIWLVLGLSLGQSAIYAVLNLLSRLVQTESLGSQSATLNGSASTSAALSAAYQIASVVFTALPALLALFLLTLRPLSAAARGTSGAAQLGLTSSRPGRDLASGVLLAAIIGIPGLGLYIAGRLAGITVNVVASDLGTHWWSIPLLLAAAAANAILEEVVVVGYLISRLRQLSVSTPIVIAISALLRGSYHLYQGFGPALGNALMGVLFGWIYTRTRRVAPLVVAHFLLDAVAFVGYSLASPWLHQVLPAVF